MVLRVHIENYPFIFQMFGLAVRSLHPNPSDICSLYINQISIAGFLDNATHYNSTAQPHLLTKIIKSVANGPNLNVVVCIICVNSVSAQSL